MTKRVIDVGNCSYDHGNVKSLIKANFDADVVQAHDMDDALQALQLGADLVLVNRRLEESGGEGIEILKRIKSDPSTSKVPVMMLSNLADAQQSARAAGAEIGFGKKELKAPETVEKLRPFLG